MRIKHFTFGAHVILRHRSLRGKNVISAWSVGAGPQKGITMHSGYGGAGIVKSRAGAEQRQYDGNSKKAKMEWLNLCRIRIYTSPFDVVPMALGVTQHLEVPIGSRVVSRIEKTDLATAGLFVFGVNPHDPKSYDWKRCAGGFCRGP